MGNEFHAMRELRENYTKELKYLWIGLFALMTIFSLALFISFTFDMGVFTVTLIGGYSLGILVMWHYMIIRSLSRIKELDEFIIFYMYVKEKKNDQKTTKKDN